MPEAGTAAETVAEPAASPAATAGAALSAAQDEAFDKDRAMHTITALRDEVKTAKKDAKRVADLEAKLKEFEDRDKTDADRAVERIAALEAREKELLGQQQESLLRAAVYEHSASLGIASSRLALAALDRAELEYDEKGEPKNLESVLTALLEREPVPKGTPAPPRAAKINSGDGAGGEKPPALTADEMNAAETIGMAPEQYAGYKEVSTVADYEKLRAREKQSA